MNIKIKCSKDKDVVRFCSTQYCTNPPLMCSEQCQCYIPHKQCMRISMIQSLLAHMQKKGSSFIPLLEIELKYCSETIKQFQILHDSIQQMIQNHKSSLEGYEGTLYKLLKEGKKEQITAALINNAINSLESRPKFFVQNKLQSAKLLLQKQIKQIKISLQKIKQIGNVKKYLINQQLQIYRKQNGWILLPAFQITNSIIKHKLTNAWKTAILDTSTEIFGNKIQTYKFKVQKTQNKNIFFGLCNKKYLLTNYLAVTGGTQWSFGVYAINGSCIYHDVAPQLQADKIVSMDLNDIVHLKYSPSNLQLQIKNVTKNQKDIFTVKTQAEDSLHPFISMYSLNDEVQYLGIQLSQ